MMARRLEQAGAHRLVGIGLDDRAGPQAPAPSHRECPSRPRQRARPAARRREGPAAPRRSRRRSAGPDRRPRHRPGRRSCKQGGGTDAGTGRSRHRRHRPAPRAQACRESRVVVRGSAPALRPGEWRRIECADRTEKNSPVMPGPEALRRRRPRPSTHLEWVPGMQTRWRPWPSSAAERRRAGFPRRA